MALVAHRFGWSWAEVHTLKSWQLSVLIEYMNKEAKRQKDAQNRARRGH